MNRIKTLRLAKGMTLDDLSRSMRGIVTKQALSKYERGLSRPSTSVAAALAAALGVNALRLWSEPAVDIRFVAYRMHSRLNRKERARIEALVQKTLEERCVLQSRLGISGSFDWAERKFPIRSPQDAENAAMKVRDALSLGLAPVDNLTATLEDRLVHVLELDSECEFDGLSAVARDETGQVMALAVTSRRAIAGDRQRMNLAHELGHLVLDPNEGYDEEAAAFRFAGAFLVPEDLIKREIGKRRTRLELYELLALKRLFKVSIQGLLRRMRDLEIISDTLYKTWQILVSKRGWRKQEPEPLSPETPEWSRRMLWRALSEGMLTPREMRQFSDCDPSLSASARPDNRLSFLRLAPERRRKILSNQAATVAHSYEDPDSCPDLETGGFLDDDTD